MLGFAPLAAMPLAASRATRVTIISLNASTAPVASRTRAVTRAFAASSSPLAIAAKAAARSFSVSRAWTPYDCPGLIAWWSADDPANGAMSSWTDRIGGLVAAQGSGSGQPTRSATAFNSAYPGVSFDGSASWLDVPGVGNLPIGTATGTMMAVVDQQSTVVANSNAENNIVGYGSQQGASNPHSSRSLRTITQDSGATRQFRIHDTTDDLTDTSVNLTGLHILAARFDTQTGYGYIDGAPTVPPSGPIAFDTKTTRIRISGTVFPPAPVAQFFKGTLRHIFIGNWTDADRQRLEGWSAWNSGLQSLLPVSHPYYSASPVQSGTGPRATVTRSSARSFGAQAAVAASLSRVASRSFSAAAQAVARASRTSFITLRALGRATATAGMAAVKRPAAARIFAIKLVSRAFNIVLRSRDYSISDD